MVYSKISIRFSLVCRWLYPASQGGVCMHNKYVYEMLKSDFQMNLISLNNSLNFKYCKKNDIPVTFISKSSDLLYRMPKASFINKSARYYRDLIISKLIAKELEKSYHSIIEFMDIHSEAYYYLKLNPKNFRRTKVVIRSHTPWGLLKKYHLKSEIEKNDTWKAFEKEKYCFQNCDAITTPSEDLKRKIIELYHINSNKIVVIPNLVDTNHFKPKEKSNSKNNGFQILHVGRFERPKGVETLTKAFIRIAKKYKNISLINVGKLRGSSASACESWLEKENLLNRVTFTDFIDYEQLPKFYQNADLIIVPSEIYESFSYTVAQALSSGKTVIASEIGGIPETINNGNAGILFTPGNIEELAQKIENVYLKKIDISAIEINARKHILNNYSLNALKGKYIQFYNHLLN